MVRVALVLWPREQDGEADFVIRLVLGGALAEGANRRTLAVFSPRQVPSRGTVLQELTLPAPG